MKSVFTVLFLMLALVGAPIANAQAAGACANEVNGALTSALTWVNGDTNAADVTRIERSFSSGGPYTVVGSVPTSTLAFTDKVTLPTSNVTLYYVVQNSSPTAGPSAVSNEVCKNFFPGPPGATGLTIQ